MGGSAFGVAMEGEKGVFCGVSSLRIILPVPRCAGSCAPMRE